MLANPGIIGALSSVEVRTNEGWVTDPPGVAMVEDPGMTSVSLFYRDIGG